MPESSKKAFERLSTDVRPLNYAIRLKPDLEKLTFEGTEEISLQVNKATKSVVLNCAEIKLSEVKYKGAAQQFESDIGISYADEDETVTLTFPEELQVGRGSLLLSFSGILNDKMKGFYRSKYFTPSGEQRFGAATQFEATEARRAFPCWDEPAIKATFDVTLIVPKDRVALSNMPVVKETELDGNADWKVLTYQKTPIMSTYLVAFVIGEYDFIEEKDSDGVIVRVYTPVGKKEQGRFALEVAVKTLPFYKNYFGIGYSLPKMDLIAISDFAGGAMENWGLITYRETALLVDEANSSASSKQTVALVVGHEIAHMWFGNLVTMEWWTNLWLKEGFASWIEYLCVDHCFPEFDIWTQFASNDFTRALELDALKNSHPIEVAVGHPSEVDEIFDTISYSKGASVIRMLHDYIGDEDYRKGMHLYLSRHEYGNTCTEDLWSALGEASGKPIEKIMNTWTKQMGFPVIKVTQDNRGNEIVLKLHQEKFTADGSKDVEKMSWMIPITVSSASSPCRAIQRSVLDQAEGDITLKGVEPGDWIKLNVGGVGFYRTLYPPDILEKLLPAVRSQSLPPRDRLQLQDDLFALARAGIASCVDVLKLTDAFENEGNFTVWANLSGNLGALSALFQYTDFHSNFLAFIRKLFGPVMKRIGWEPSEGEGHLSRMLRSLVVGRLGRAGDPDVIEESRKRFARHCDGSQPLPADLRSAIYGIVLKHGGTSEYEAMMKLLQSSDLQEEKVRILRSLGITSDPALIQRTLEFSLSSDVRSQDTVGVIGGVTGSVEGRRLAWKFLQDNWEELHRRYRGGFLLSRLVSSTTGNFASEAMAVEVEEFFKLHPAPAAERTIQQSLENIRLNQRQLERNVDEVKRFLAAFK